MTRHTSKGSPRRRKLSSSFPSCLLSHLEMSDPNVYQPSDRPASVQRLSPDIKNITSSILLDTLPRTQLRNTHTLPRHFFETHKPFLDTNLTHTQTLPRHLFDTHTLPRHLFDTHTHPSSTLLRHTHPSSTFILHTHTLHRHQFDTHKPFIETSSTHTHPSSTQTHSIVVQIPRDLPLPTIPWRPSPPPSCTE